MKTLSLLVLGLVLATTAAAAPVTQSRAWTERFPVDATLPQLTISNIWGNVRIRQGAIGEIVVTVDERRSAPDQARFDRSLDLLGLDVRADAEGVSFAVGGDRRGYERFDGCRGCRVEYQFEVLVPAGTMLDVATVLDGKIDVAGVGGAVSARNVNGPVDVADVQNCGLLESVNGRVDVRFSNAPGADCNIETVNGDITLALPNGSGLDVALDLFNGRLVSEFEVDSLPMPAIVEKTSNDGSNSYRIRQAAGLRVAGGGPTFSISSLNGDIRIQKSE